MKEFRPVTWEKCEVKSVKKGLYLNRSYLVNMEDTQNFSSHNQRSVSPASNISKRNIFTCLALSWRIEQKWRAKFLFFDVLLRKNFVIKINKTKVRVCKTIKGFCIQNLIRIRQVVSLSQGINKMLPIICVQTST